MTAQDLSALSDEYLLREHMFISIRVEEAYKNCPNDIDLFHTRANYMRCLESEILKRMRKEGKGEI